jgi:hypothetical protein
MTTVVHFTVWFFKFLTNGHHEFSNGLQQTVVRFSHAEQVAMSVAPILEQIVNATPI